MYISFNIANARNWPQTWGRLKPLQLLSDDPLYPKKLFTHAALLVERLMALGKMEAWVCMTVAVVDAQAMYSGKTDRWPPLHENLVSDHYQSGKTSSGPYYMVELSE